MDAWVGPAIVAAIVSGLVTMAGWLVTFMVTIRLDQVRRDEKVRDFQVALRAEIHSDVLNMEGADRGQFLEAVTAAYHADDQYSPVIPRLAGNVVFDAIIRDIHILPGRIIEPVVHYARLRQTLDRFIDDLRAEAFRQLEPERQLLMYADYLAMYDRLESLAVEARYALDQSLNSSAADRPTPAEALGSGGAAASDAGSGSP